MHLFTVPPTGVNPILLTSLSARLIVAVDTDRVVQVAAVVSACMIICFKITPEYHTIRC